MAVTFCRGTSNISGRYEKYQRRTLRIEPYEAYLEQW